MAGREGRGRRVSAGCRHRVGLRATAVPSTFSTIPASGSPGEHLVRRPCKRTIAVRGHVRRSELGAWVGVSGELADRAARFERCYVHCYWPVLRFVVRRVGDEVSARDLTADVFTVAWQRWDQVPHHNPLPWLYATARNVVAHEHRRRARDIGLAQRLVDYQGPRLICPDPAEQTALLQQLIQAFGRLSVADREVLALHLWEDLDGKDLAAVLGCSTTAANVRLHRARRRLRRALAVTDMPNTSNSEQRLVRQSQTRSKE